MGSDVSAGDAAGAREHLPARPATSVRHALVDRPWPDVGRPVVFIPLGSTEQHGPHLPLDTDALIASAVAEALAAQTIETGTDAVVAPLIGYGSSGEHEAFAGTVSIGREALALVLLEYGRSASHWADRIVFVNGHGGNVDVLREVMPPLAVEDRRAAWLPCVPPPLGPDGPPPDAHAGRIETSLLLHLDPARVRLDRLEPGNISTMPELLDALREGGVASVAPNGVLGDPRGASAGEGARLFDSMVEEARRRYFAWNRGPDGCLL